MPSTPGQRVAGIIVLVVCLGGLLIWFGSLAPNPAVGAYPGGHELGTNYDAYLDESVVVGGIVVETDPLTIAVEYGVDEVIELRVVDENTQLEATQGDHVTLFGTANLTRRSLLNTRTPFRESSTSTCTSFHLVAASGSSLELSELGDSIGILGHSSPTMKTP